MYRQDRPAYDSGENEQVQLRWSGGETRSLKDLETFLLEK